MRSNTKRVNRIELTQDRRTLTGRLLCEYTLLFFIFFGVVLSPFWLYGKTFFWGTDGSTQYLPELTYSRYWAKTVFSGITGGSFSFPLWSLWVGLGQKTFDNVINYRLFNFLYCLFPREAIEQYQMFRVLAGMYLSGLSFLAYGRTRTRDRMGLLLGSMLYLFGGFIPLYTTKHWLFLEMTFAFPLMLLGVDQIFDGKWSWLFIFVVFKTAMSYFYSVLMVTLPAVIYALFHYYELDGSQRSERGGFGRIFLRHVVQYVAGIGLAAVSLFPCIVDVLNSSRTSTQKVGSYLHWPTMTYLDYIRGIVDVQAVVHNGYLALPSIALVAILYMLYTRRKQDRLLLGQVAFYNLGFLIPAITMLFSLFAGASMRWCYVFSFWTALSTAVMLPRLQGMDTGAYRFCVKAVCVYSVIYICTCIWTGNAVSISLALVFLGLLAIGWMISNQDRRNPKLAMTLVCLLLLVELGTKSYEWYSPQYGNHVSNFSNAGTVYESESNSASGILKTISDDGVYRSDLISKSGGGSRQTTNYGIRDHINGVSSYYNMNGGSLVSWSLELGNAHQPNIFMINDLDQRTVLNELAGVKYAVALEEGLSHLPYGYKLLETREYEQADGTRTSVHLYENSYALPLAYTYARYIPYDVYAQLPPNRKEQAMLQGVILQGETPLEAVTPVFDDQILMDTEALLEVLESIAAGDDNLEIREGKLQVKKANYTVTVPVKSEAGEIYLQFRGLHFRSVNYYGEEAVKRAEQGEARVRVMASRRNARQWESIESAAITATAGAFTDTATLLGEDNQYYYGKKDLLLNLGCGEIKKNIKIKFSEPGEYAFDGMALICQPMEGYGDKVAPLQARGAVSTRVDGNHVSFEFETGGDELAVITIPYDKGWSAVVDGQPAQIVQANVAFMGVMLTKGAHTVEFSYMPKGLKLGAAISLVTLVALIGVGVAQALRRRRSRG